jgi:spoIIIJ-associated protein
VTLFAFRFSLFAPGFWLEHANDQAGMIAMQENLNVPSQELPMSIPDKIAAANKINEFLQAVVTHGGLRLKYRIVVDPPVPDNRDWEKPEILVDFAGPDSTLLLDRGGELLRALELLALEMLRLPSGEHEKISFDCQNHRSLRIQELRTAAAVAADKVRKTGTPYQFSPMSSRERRIVHLALRDQADLHTESEGEGMRRCLVVYPKDYKPAGKPTPKTLP